MAIAKFRINRYMVLAATASLLYPSLFIFNYELSGESIFCSFIHAALAAFLVYNIAFKAVIKRRRVNMQIIFILMNLFYLNISSVKYYSKELYSGFVSDNFDRLIFSIASMVVIWICFLSIKTEGLVFSEPKFKLRRTGFLSFLTLLLVVIVIYILYATYSAGEVYKYYAMADLRDLGAEQRNMSFLEKAIGFLAGFLINLIPVLIALKYKEKYFFVYMGGSFVLALTYAVIFATRAALLYYYFIFFVALYYVHGVGRAYIALLVMFAPLLIAISAVTVMPLTKSIDILDKNEILRQLTYRFDVTDFSATLISKADLNFSYKIVVDALVYAIPKDILPWKYDYITDAYSESVRGVNLDPDVDYTDSMFSVGAQVFGLVGFVSFPVLFVFLLGWLEKAIFSFFKESAKVIIPCCSIIYLRIENDLNGFMTDWRFLPLFIIVGCMLSKLFICKVSRSRED